MQSEGRRLLIAADAANHYVVSLQRPDWHVRFDMDKEMAAATRKELFGMIAADRVPFIGYHMPFPAVGYLEASGPGFRYMPATYQFEL
ncbi:MAG: glyoxylase-like metal-dependent hydrolase (beta-lactamase superfamily II) [Paracoccaceae bacterium]